MKNTSYAMNVSENTILTLFIWTIRVVCPVGILIIFLNQFGII